MKKHSSSLLTSFVVGAFVTSAQFGAYAQLTVQRPVNVVGSGSNAWSYLVMEGESFIDGSEADGNPASGFGKVYNDEALIDGYGNPILLTNKHRFDAGRSGCTGTHVRSLR